MAFVTALDRLIQAGGTGVTLALWLLSIVGGIATVAGWLPGWLSMLLTGVAITVVWMRFRSITIVELLVRIGYTEWRYAGRGD